MAFFRKISVLTLVLAAFYIGSPASADDRINPDNYPTLNEKQIGHLRHFLKLSRQLPGDWSEMGDNWFSLPERSLRYQLANMIYASGSAQFNLTPAYRELYQEVLDSNFKCNPLVFCEGLEGCEVSEAFTGCSVIGPHDVYEVIVAPLIDCGFSGQAAAEDAVGILD